MTAFSLAGLSVSIAEENVWRPDLSVEVPEPMREFRGVWVTTVYNLDWPSRPGLSPEVQRIELREILDKVAAVNLNAVVLQVRTMCDALYDSPIEPWSYYLTGELGKPPEPFYDPLEFAIEEAHARGLELHAWFNPFRAATASYGRTTPENHVTRQYPWLTRKNGTHKWLDPSSEFVRNRALAVVFDVISRYDVDAVHFDDYFYPYPRKNRPPGLDDSANWQRHRLPKGIEESDEALAEWRRGIVDGFIQDLYAEVKRAKPWVKVGISPFGIWRPKHPAGIDGLDAWRLIYADSRKWIREGWVDYFSPQLYWKRGGEQSFTALYSWWQDQNVLGRHLWPGIAASRIGKKGSGEADGRDAMEVLEQISYTRTDLGKAPAAGQLHWRWEAYATNRGGIRRLITKKRYAERAIPPPSPWLAGQGDAEDAGELPEVKELKLSERKIGSGDEKPKETFWRLAWEPKAGSENPVRWWVIQTRHGEDWKTFKLVPEHQIWMDLKPSEIDGVDAVAVRAVSRIGELGPIGSLVRVAGKK